VYGKVDGSPGNGEAHGLAPKPNRPLCSAANRQFALWLLSYYWRLQAVLRPRSRTTGNDCDTHFNKLRTEIDMAHYSAKFTCRGHLRC
jgi:hypothetical protein